MAEVSIKHPFSGERLWSGDVGPDGSLVDLGEEHGGEVYVTGTGQIIGNPHPRETCRNPDNCVIHSPSEHSMREFPTHFRFDRYLMERICPHGVGHPDPDDLAFDSSNARGVHGCDGCCA